MKKKVLVLALLATSNQAGAGELRIGTTLASKHFFDAPQELGGFCESNPGIELEYQSGKVFVSAGRYRNSVCDYSTFLGFGIELDSGPVFGIPMYTGIEAGIADGYGKLIEANESVPTTGGNVLMGGGYFRFGETHQVKLRYMVVNVALSYQYSFNL